MQISDRKQLTAIWPLYGLILKTPRLELRIPIELEIVELAEVVARGIQKPGEPQFQASSLYQPSPVRERKLLQAIYASIVNWKPEDWDSGFAVFYEDKPIGMQSIFSKHFNRTRGFGSGAWLGLEYQGLGFGTEMHDAILKLGFDGLGGREAYVGAWADNAASIRVMEKLGYIPNGQYYQLRGDDVQQDVRMRLPRAVWESKTHDAIMVEGLDERCLELFGARDSS